MQDCKSASAIVKVMGSSGDTLMPEAKPNCNAIVIMCTPEMLGELWLLPSR